ncbi:MAG TPA: hypothetical protein VN877_08345, partial [Opitutaceae bacterium]|nr:hypothetical protein [Opitutaceae bacterium]
MNRAQYARYVLLRLAEALAIALGAGLLAHFLQRLGWLAPLEWGPLRLRARQIPGVARALALIGWWTWPVAWALMGHVVLGPKQRRPVYRRIPGAMYAYAGIKVDRNAGCRGGCVTGATGSGKTLACIVPRLHSLCVNEAGAERPGWRGSRAGRDFRELKGAHRGRQREALAKIDSLGASEDRAAGAAGGIDEQIGRLRQSCDRGDRDLRDASDACREARYRAFPWGGFVCGEKGNEWQLMEGLMRCHGREEDLCVLRTRPSWAPRDWAPLVRFNLVSMDGIPADTYAKMIVDTGLAVEEAPSRDEFFVPQARDKIAWGIRLIRSVRDAAVAPNPAAAGPSLLSLLEILTVQESYRRYLVRCASENPL